MLRIRVLERVYACASPRACALVFFLDGAHHLQRHPSPTYISKQSFVRQPYPSKSSSAQPSSSLRAPISRLAKCASSLTSFCAPVMRSEDARRYGAGQLRVAAFAYVNSLLHIFTATSQAKIPACFTPHHTRWCVHQRPTRAPRPVRQADLDGARLPNQAARTNH